MALRVAQARLLAPGLGPQTPYTPAPRLATGVVRLKGRRVPAPVLRVRTRRVRAGHVVVAPHLVQASHIVPAAVARPVRDARPVGVETFYVGVVGAGEATRVVGAFLGRRVVAPGVGAVAVPVRPTRLLLAATPAATAARPPPSGDTRGGAYLATACHGLGPTETCPVPFHGSPAYPVTGPIHSTYTTILRGRVTARPSGAAGRFRTEWPATRRAATVSLGG